MSSFVFVCVCRFRRVVVVFALASEEFSATTNSQTDLSTQRASDRRAEMVSATIGGRRETRTARYPRCGVVQREIPQRKKDTARHGKTEDGSKRSGE